MLEATSRLMRYSPQTIAPVVERPYTLPCHAVNSIIQSLLKRLWPSLRRRLAQHLADPQIYPEVQDPAVDLIYFRGSSLGHRYALATSAVRCI